MKRITFLVIAISLFQNAYAQDLNINQSKYWFYRYRLISEFLAKGESSCGVPSGLSIPSGGAYVVPSTNQSTGQYKYDTKINFGDGTSFLGYYIGVLATEYKLLINRGAPGWQVDKTKEELYYAMKAYERLDKNAEYLPPSTSIPGSCEDQFHFNGFFLRDDVPATDSEPVLAQSFNEKFKYKINREFSSDLGNNGTKSLDELSGSDKGADLFNSQDQVADLIVGFSLVVKLMDNESWLGYNFKNNAKLYSDKMFSYLQIHDYFIPIPGQEGKCREVDKGWNNDNLDIHINPVTHTDCLVHHGGSENRINAYSYAKAGSAIKNEKMGSATVFDVGLTDTDYQTYMTTLLKPVWDNLNYPLGQYIFDTNTKKGDDGKLLQSSNDWNNALICEYAAVGNSWEVGFYPNKVFDEDLNIPVPAPCRHEEHQTVCLPWPRNDECWTIDFNWVDWTDWSCNIPLGRLEVYCYSAPAGYVIDRLLYEEMARRWDLGKGFSAAVTDLLSKNGIVDLRTCLPFISPPGLVTPIDLPHVGLNTTGYSLSRYGDTYGTQLFTLLHKVLQDNHGDYSFNEDNINYILNTAPCNGPHFYPFNDPNVNSTASIDPNNPPFGDEGNWGWRNDNRFQKTIDAEDRTEPGRASYPGLDYMLFYNLYQLSMRDNGNFDNYTDQMDLSVSNQVFPKNSDGTILGSDLNHKKYVGYESIVSNNLTVNSGSLNTNDNGNVEMKAGENIKFTDLQIKSGANFKAFIGRVTPCSDYNSFRQQSAPVSKSETKKMMTDEQLKDKIQTAITKGIKDNEATLKAYQNKNYQPVAAYLQAQESITTKEELKISLYPNPVSKNVTITSTGGEISSVALYDNLGNELYNEILKQGSTNIILSTENLSGGIYFLKIYCNNQVTIKKIIKSL